MLDISKEVHSLSDFKRKTPELLQQMRESGHPMVLTVNGKPEVIVQDAASYQKLLEHVDQLETLEGIKRGRTNIEAGSVTSLEDFEKEFRKKHRIPRRPR